MKFIKITYWVLVVLLLFANKEINAQQTIEAHSTYQKCINPSFEKKIDKLLSHSVPEIIVGDLKEKFDAYLVLDARELEEFNTSHIPNAVHLGYNNYDLNILDEVDKDQMIVVYCSIGYRSEKIAEILEKKGFKYVYNLYGSIFEWANQGYKLVDTDNIQTFEIHTYSKKWSKWVDNPDLIKIW